MKHARPGRGRILGGLALLLLNCSQTAGPADAGDCGPEGVAIQFVTDQGGATGSCYPLSLGPVQDYQVMPVGGGCTPRDTVANFGTTTVQADIVGTGAIFAAAMVQTVTIDLTVPCGVATGCSLRSTSCAFRVTQAGPPGSTVSGTLDRPCMLSGTDGSATGTITALTLRGTLGARTFNGPGDAGRPTPCP